MTSHDPAMDMSVAADIADALDPDLEEGAREAAARSAIKQDPMVAILLTTWITRGLIEGLATQHPDGTAGMMAQIRRNMTLIPAESPNPIPRESVAPAHISPENRAQIDQISTDIRNNRLPQEIANAREVLAHFGNRDEAFARIAVDLINNLDARVALLAAAAVLKMAEMDDEPQAEAS